MADDERAEGMWSMHRRHSTLGDLLQAYGEMLVKEGRVEDGLRVVHEGMRIEKEAEEALEALGACVTLSCMSSGAAEEEPSKDLKVLMAMSEEVNRLQEGLGEIAKGGCSSMTPREEGGGVLDCGELPGRDPDTWCPNCRIKYLLRRRVTLTNSERSNP